MNMTHEDHEAVAKIARTAVYGVDFERFAEMSLEDVWDELQPEVFGAALELERLDDVEAAEISDSVYEALDEFRSQRYAELMQDGLI
jgi:hypothetical protein